MGVLKCFALVISGSLGRRLVFRYPDPASDFNNMMDSSNKFNVQGTSNVNAEKTLAAIHVIRENFSYESAFLAEILSCLQSKLHNTRLELTIDDFLYVGHPTSLPQHGSLSAGGAHYRSTVMSSLNDVSGTNGGGGGDGNRERREAEETCVIAGSERGSKTARRFELFNVVAVLERSTPSEVIDLYHNLVSQFAAALKHEEIRTGYFTEQVNIALSVLDSCAHRSDDPDEASGISTTAALAKLHGSVDGINQQILSQSQLARDFQYMFNSLRMGNEIRLKLNGWIDLRFNLAPRQPYEKSSNIVGTHTYHSIDPVVMRAYHAIMLLVEKAHLLENLPSDCSPSLFRLIQCASSMKSFDDISADSDIPLPQVFRLAAHLVHWGKAIIIDKLSRHNIYVVPETANTDLYSILPESFSTAFPTHTLSTTLARFSHPPRALQDHMASLGGGVVGQQDQQELVAIVEWLLRHRLLVQLHTYVFLVCPVDVTSNTGIDHLLNAPVNVLERISPTSRKSNSTDNSRPECNSAFESDSDGEGPNNGNNDRTDVEAIIEGLRLLLQPPEWTAVMQVGASVIDMRLFERLCPYFRGSTHIEEIMFRENMTRANIMALINTFSSVLVTCVY